MPFIKSFKKNNHEKIIRNNKEKVKYSIGKLHTLLSLKTKNVNKVKFLTKI